MNLRDITLDDHPKVYAFWEHNYFVKELDSFENFKLFLDKNPKLSVLVEENGEIVGTALGSFDGRRGYLQKLVTKKELRGKGIGKMMVLEVVKRLKKVGTTYIPITAEHEYVEFYKKCGFKINNATPLNIEL
jgi:N-acetylglutamate synthase